MERISHQQFNAQDAITKYPPQLSDRNKQILFDISSPPGASHSGTISFSRWNPMALPETVRRGAARPDFQLRTDFFDYGPSSRDSLIWHLNFAHNDLFRFYGGSLFAQDEIQVAEHPVLASLRHGLLDVGINPLTVENGVPTPVLAMGVERRCRVSTDMNPDEGRPYGLYGNMFARASADAIHRATEVIAPPTISNIIAIEAPPYGTGRYTHEQLTYVLTTAITGFSAARLESLDKIPGVQTSIHTGFWGCGAYGGNRILMALLQMIAACGAEIDSLVFHSGPDSTEYHEASRLLEGLLPQDQESNLERLVSRIEAFDFHWGTSDGT